tara:strand:- start:4460 stop:5638 length:1179 start_codon:yes stop_codon:yes gene_type:complete
MKYTLGALFFSFYFGLGFSQNLDSLNVSKINDTIKSNFLNERRAIEIQLPRSYETDVMKNYPLIIVMDGDYMFNLVSGTVDYLSFWGDIPENLVVGISQRDSRFDDSSNLDPIDYTPISSTANFYDFLINELIPYITKNYRVSNFRILVGHERTANFINFFLLKENPVIRGIVSISPKFTTNMDKYITEKLKGTKSKIIYTLSSSKKDFETIYRNVKDFSETLDSIENKNLMFKSLIFENENHYILPSVSVPTSIRNTYSLYSDIDKVEYDSIISKLDTSPIEYLQNKYQLIKDFYEIDKTISINDFLAIEDYIESFERYELYNDLSEIANEEYPETIVSSYYKGRFYEETGQFEKAMYTYKSAYILSEVKGFFTKDYLLQLADEIKSDFNL